MELVIIRTYENQYEWGELLVNAAQSLNHGILWISMKPPSDEEKPIELLKDLPILSLFWEATLHDPFLRYL